MGRIVVGVDQSEGSVAALRWAYNEAKIRGATLDVVHAWTWPDPTDPVRPRRAGWHALKRAASQRLSSVVDEHIGAQPEIPVVTTLVNSDPAHALLADAVDAEMLVVGTRDQRPLDRLVHGSVSRHCVTHAPCPVAVIRAAGGPARSSGSGSEAPTARNLSRAGHRER